MKAPICPLAVAVRAHDVALRDLRNQCRERVSSAESKLEAFVYAWAMIEVHNVRFVPNGAVGAGPLFSPHDDLVSCICSRATFLRKSTPVHASV